MLRKKQQNSINMGKNRILILFIILAILLFQLVNLSICREAQGRQQRQQSFNSERILRDGRPNHPPTFVILR